jgi:hypothetical protein
MKRDIQITHRHDLFLAMKWRLMLQGPSITGSSLTAVTVSGCLQERAVQGPNAQYQGFLKTQEQRGKQTLNLGSKGDT